MNSINKVIMQSLMLALNVRGVGASDMNLG